MPVLTDNDTELYNFTEEQVKRIRILYASTSNELRNVIEDAINEKITLGSKNETLATIAILLTKTQQETDGLLLKIIPAAYNLGIKDTTQRLPRRFQDIELGAVHAIQVNAFLSEAALDFGTGLEGAKKSAGQLLSRVFQEQLRDRMLEGKEKGFGAPKIAQEVLSELKDLGFSTFIRRDGRKMGLRAYAEMLTRTHVIRSANEGTIKRANEVGFTIFEMSDHVGECALCRPYEGKLFDSTGKKFNKPPSMPIHPNCRHKLLVRPELQ